MTEDPRAIQAALGRVGGKLRICAGDNSSATRSYWDILETTGILDLCKRLKDMVARDGIGWNYKPLDGLTLYPKQTIKESTFFGSAAQRPANGATRA